ncbi:hypothetical protein LWI29_038458 [Acer saccharum]|uniref:Uncharacterized protein n=1 Tax=Acer saccharum TaxID=4024 RepID=A0AA39SYG6_ACESA|nr:hypothetical protein LWI29_038458 [Acer saccharum]
MAKAHPKAMDADSSIEREGDNRNLTETCKCQAGKRLEKMGEPVNINEKAISEKSPQPNIPFGRVAADKKKVGSAILPATDIAFVQSKGVGGENVALKKGKGPIIVVRNLKNLDRSNNNEDGGSFAVDIGPSFLSDKAHSKNQALLLGCSDNHESFVEETQEALQGKTVGQGISLCIDLRDSDLRKLIPVESMRWLRRMLLFRIRL